MDGQDIGNAAQNTAVYALGGVAGNAAKGYGLLARMGATGVTEGGLNVAAQKMAGREDVNEKEALLTGLTGAAAEGITPMISKAWRWLKNQDVSNLQAGKVMAKEMGADLADDQAERLGKMVRTLDPDQVTPESILAHVELDQEPTMGTLTGNQKLLDREAFLRQSGRKSTIDQLELLDRRNAEGLTDSVLKQTPNAPNKIKGADRVGQAVQQKAADMDEVAKAAWDKIPDATASSGPITQAGKNIQTRFKNSTRYIDEDMTPAAYKAAEKIDKFSKQLEAGDGTVDWNRINLERKRVGNMYTAAKTKEDRAALRIVKEEFEKTYRDAFETHLFSGDPKVIDKLDDAVSASRDYFDMFSAETGDAGGKAVESWLDKGIPPEKIAETFFTKKNSSIKANAVPVMRKLKQVLGEDSESFKSVQEMAIQGVMGGKNKASMRTALRNAFDSDPTFMNELFDKKQLDFMARTLEFLDGTALKGVAGRSSGTTERIFRWINQNVSQDYSLSGMANLLKKAAGVITGGERRMMSLPLEQIKFNPLVPLSNQPAQQDE